MIVKFTVLGTDFQTEVVGAKSEADAHDHVTTEIAKRFVETFRIKEVTQVRTAPKRRSIFSTYADGFRCFAESFKSAKPQ